MRRRKRSMMGWSVVAISIFCMMWFANCGGKKAAGEACQNADECAAGLACKESKCGATTPSEQGNTEPSPGDAAAEPGQEPRAELTTEPKDEPKAEPKDEPGQEPAAEPKDEPNQDTTQDAGNEPVQDAVPEAPPEVVMDTAPQGFDAKNCGRDSDCASGEVCYRANVCLKPCDKAKGVKSNPDCGAGFVCAPWTSSKSVCKKSCDNASGKFGNKDCATKFYCSEGSGDLAPGYCEPNRKAVPGPKKQGETCDPFNASLGCVAGFQCVDFTCVAVCVPGSQKGCAASEECAEATNLSPTGGYCAPPAKQAAGDWCDNIGRRCNAGLTCRSRQCRKPCKKDGECGSGQLCANQFCYKRCSRANDVGSATKRYNTDCQAGQYCDVVNSKPVCRAAQRAPNPAGKKKVGESCQVNDEKADTACSSQDKLVCSGKCKEACDPRKGATNNPDCDAGSKKCTPSVFSYLNGLCDP